MPGQRLRTFGDYTKPLNLKPRAKLDLDGRRAAGQHGATEAWISCEQRSEDMLRETKKQLPEINPTRALRPSRETIQGAAGSSQLGAGSR